MMPDNQSLDEPRAGGQGQGHAPESLRQRNLANARLIAAAPDLLTALEEISRLCWGGQGTYDYEWQNARETAQAAIAKARGEA